MTWICAYREIPWKCEDIVAICCMLVGTVEVGCLHERSSCLTPGHSHVEFIHPDLEALAREVLSVRVAAFHTGPYVKLLNAHL